MITVTKDTWEVWLSLAGSGLCQINLNEDDVKGWYVRIERIGGDGQVLEYDVIDAHNDEVCVYFDKLLHESPPGHYKATLFNKQDEILAEFKLYIPKRHYTVRNVRSQDTIC